MIFPRAARWLRIRLPLGALLLSCISIATLVHAQGDEGNGKYRNPVLYSDYSDPDVIRVKDTYYLVSSSFHF